MEGAKPPGRALLTAFQRLQHVEGELNNDILEEVSHWFLDDDVDDLYKRHEPSSLFSFIILLI